MFESPRKHQTKLIKMKKKPTIAISPVSHEYLTKGKEYEIIKWVDDNSFFIKNDLGGSSFCLSKRCASINGLSWTLK